MAAADTISHTPKRNAALEQPAQSKDARTIPIRVESENPGLDDPGASLSEPVASIDPIHVALAGVDAASLARCCIEELNRIFDGIVELTSDKTTAHGLACVGASLAERYQDKFFGLTHELQQSFDAMKGGAA